jgi:hypothetical protein
MVSTMEVRISHNGIMSRFLLSLNAGNVDRVYLRLLS